MIDCRAGADFSPPGWSPRDDGSPSRTSVKSAFLTPPPGGPLPRVPYIRSVRTRFHKSRTQNTFKIKHLRTKSMGSRAKGPVLFKCRAPKFHYWINS